LNTDTIFEKLKELLTSEFKVDAESITLDKRFDDDFELESLDMVDLIIALKDNIGEKVDPSLFRDVHTVQEAVDLLQPLWKGA
jgi:acyl carrier protein